MVGEVALRLSGPPRQLPQGTCWHSRSRTANIRAARSLSNLYSGLSLSNAFRKSSVASNPHPFRVLTILVSRAGEQSGNLVTDGSDLPLHVPPVACVPVCYIQFVQRLGKCRCDFFGCCCHKSSPQWCNHSTSGQVEAPRRSTPFAGDNHLRRVNVSLDSQAFQCVAPVFQRVAGEEMSTVRHVPTFEFVNRYHGASLPNAFKLSSLTVNWRRRFGFYVLDHTI
jgi:hypothetical protein